MPCSANRRSAVARRRSRWLTEPIPSRDGIAYGADMTELPLVVHRRTCPLCEAMCGLKIHVRGDRVEKITPDADDVWSRGHICPKGTTLGALHHDPDRIRRPMLKQP